MNEGPVWGHLRSREILGQINLHPPILSPSILDSELRKLLNSVKLLPDEVLDNIFSHLEDCTFAVMLKLAEFNPSIMAFFAGLSWRQITPEMLLHCLECGCLKVFKKLFGKSLIVAIPSNLAYCRVDLALALRSALKGQSIECLAYILDLIKYKTNYRYILDHVPAIFAEQFSLIMNGNVAAATNGSPETSLANAWACLSAYFSSISTTSAIVEGICAEIARKSLETQLFFFKAFVTVRGFLNSYQQVCLFEFFSRNGRTLLLTLQERDFAGLQYLLSLGFETESKGTDGFTPFLYSARIAILDNNHGAMHLLHKEGADINAVLPSNNAAAIHLATVAGDFVAVEYLLKAGADLRAKCDMHHGNIFKDLIRDGSSLTPAEEQIVAKADATAPEVVCSRKFDGCRPIELAVFRDNLPLVQLLAQAMMNDYKGYDAPQRWDALRYAIYLGNVEMVETLISIGANIHLMDDDGNMPIHGGVLSGHAKVVKALLKANASPLVRNGQGFLPRHLVEEIDEKEAKEIEKVLWEGGGMKEGPW